MIDRDQLTEARDAYYGRSMHEAELIERALGLLLDFPTDEMVEAVLALLQDEADTRQVLRVVRRVMFGET